MLVDTAQRDLSVELFGLRMPSPIFIKPIEVTGLCAQDGHGDIAAARVAAATGVPFVGSTLMNDKMETVAEALGDTPGFFQLYTPRDKAVAQSLVGRAEMAGYKAIIVTLDTWVTGWRPRDLNASNFPQLRGHVLVNYFTDPVFRSWSRSRLRMIPPQRSETRPSYLEWSLLGPTSVAPVPRKLPLLLKGICHPDDARRALDAGVDGIYCSNHGGRQANGGVPAIDMLATVVTAAGDAPVPAVHSGIRSGTDVIKALALGPGRSGSRHRPAVYLRLGSRRHRWCFARPKGLAEADLLMAVNGYPTVADVRLAGVSRIHP